MDTDFVAITDYLDRLERAAQVLPPERRAELLAEIRQHIAQAGAVEGLQTEAEVRSLLDRLGTPEEIVEAAAEGADPSWSSVPASARIDGRTGPDVGVPKRSLTLEIWAVLMLSIGSVLLPVIGWLVGVVLLWSSDRWWLREKLLGTLVIPGGLGAFLILGVFGFRTQSSQACAVSSATPIGAGSPVNVSTCAASDSGSWVSHILVPGLFVVAALAAVIMPLYLLHLARSKDRDLIQRA